MRPMGGPMGRADDYMPLNDFVALVDPEGGGAFGGTAEPAAGITATGFFCSLQGRFGIGMWNSFAGVFGFLYGPSGDPGGAGITRCPDVIWDFGDGWGNKNGLMWIHGPKGNASLCQSAAASTVHGHMAFGRCF